MSWEGVQVDVVAPEPILHVVDIDLAGNSGGTEVVITGEELPVSPVATVMFGTVQGVVVSASATEYRVEVPAYTLDPDTFEQVELTLDISGQAIDPGIDFFIMPDS